MIVREELNNLSIKYVEDPDIYYKDGNNWTRLWDGVSG